MDMHSITVVGRLLAREARMLAKVADDADGAAARRIAELLSDPKRLARVLGIDAEAQPDAAA